MNKKVFKLSIIDNKLPLFICFCFLVGTIVSFYLSVFISNYFYFLTLLILLLTLYIIKSTLPQVKEEYKRLIKKEKYLKDGCHLSYFDNKKKQVRSEINIFNGQKHGTCKYYYYNGQISEDSNYEFGKLHCEYKEYHVNGNLKNETQYKEGIQYGETKSFYDNGNKYREFNLINGEYVGEIKEYFRNGNLKFIKNEAKYTFFDEVQKHMLFDGNLSLVNGVWNSYRNDGTIEYQLDFEDKKEKALKIIFTKSGEFYSKIHYDYKLFKGIHVNYSNEFAIQRLDSKTITKRSTVKGPPGAYNGFTVNVSQIKSIKDIIELIPIKDFKNE